MLRLHPHWQIPKQNTCAKNGSWRKFKESVKSGQKKLLMNQGSFQRLLVRANSPKKRRSVPFSSHLAINSVAYLITSPLSKFSNSGFAFLFGKLNLWNFIDMKQGADGWTLIQSGSISYSGGVPVLTAFVSSNSVKLRHKKTGQKVKPGLIAAKMSVRTSNTKRTTLSAETLARTRHSFERSKEHWSEERPPNL